MTKRMTKRADGRYQTTFTHDGTRHTACPTTLETERGGDMGVLQVAGDDGEPVDDQVWSASIWVESSRGSLAGTSLCPLSAGSYELWPFSRPL